jgi:hypothetical protein
MALGMFFLSDKEKLTMQFFKEFPREALPAGLQT